MIFYSRNWTLLLWSRFLIPVVITLDEEEWMHYHHGAAGMLLNKHGMFTMGTLESSLFFKVLFLTTPQI
jgi:hypothetical protein